MGCQGSRAVAPGADNTTTVVVPNQIFQNTCPSRLFTIPPPSASDLFQVVEDGKANSALQLARQLPSAAVARDAITGLLKRRPELQTKRQQLVWRAIAAIINAHSLHVADTFMEKTSKRPHLTKWLTSACDTPIQSTFSVIRLILEGGIVADQKVLDNCFLKILSYLRQYTFTLVGYDPNNNIVRSVKALLRLTGKAQWKSLQDGATRILSPIVIFCLSDMSQDCSISTTVNPRMLCKDFLKATLKYAWGREYGNPATAGNLERLEVACPTLNYAAAVLKAFIRVGCQETEAERLAWMERMTWLLLKSLIIMADRPLVVTFLMRVFVTLLPHQPKRMKYENAPEIKTLLNEVEVIFPVKSLLPPRDNFTRSLQLKCALVIRQSIGADRILVKAASLPLPKLLLR